MVPIVYVVNTKKLLFIFGILCIALLWRFGSVSSQIGPHAIEETSVLGARLNIEDPSGDAFHHFYEALERVEEGKGKARLLFYGASHTAFDQYTGYLRTRLQKRFGDGGHGFVVPAPPFPHYQRKNVLLSHQGVWEGLRVRNPLRVRDYYGLAGFAVETKRTGAWCSLRPSRSKGMGHSVDRFEVYYWEQPNGGRMGLFVDGHLMKRVPTDSLTARPNYATLNVSEGYHRLRIRALDSRPLRLFGVVMERSAPGVVVDSMGVPGARAEEQLYWNETLQREHLRHRNPDLVALAYGTNESGDDHVPLAEYKTNLRRVMNRIRKAVPQASCLLIGPSDRPVRLEDNTFQERARTLDIIRIQKQTAREFGCGFFDLVKFQGGPLSMPKWVETKPPFARKDYVHFTDLGHQRLAEVLEEALLENY